MHRLLEIIYLMAATVGVIVADGPSMIAAAVVLAALAIRAVASLRHTRPVAVAASAVPVAVTAAPAGQLPRLT